jgi:hypothetical protein
VRTYALLQLTLLVALAGCTNARHAAAASAAPSPLRACETREVKFDGADVVVAGNVDATVGSIQVVDAPSAAAKAKALDDAYRNFGKPRPDTRVVQHANKWGLTTYTDLCGHLVRSTNNAEPVTPAR